MVLALADGAAALAARSDVSVHTGRVTRIQRRSQQLGGWRVELGDNAVGADAVILCTGSQPKLPPDELVSKLTAAGVEVLDHDDAVVPDRFAASALPQMLNGRRLAVVGPSHSGCLAAQNALERGAAASVMLIGLETAGPRFCEERDGGAWLKYDGTGLKGSVGAWTRAALAADDSKLLYRATSGTPNKVDAMAIADMVIEFEAAALAWTVGFERSLPPEVLDDDGSVIHLSHDGSGTLSPRAKGLAGAGIAFPEKLYFPIRPFVRPLTPNAKRVRRNSSFLS